MIVDMSPQAVTTRLKRVAQLRATYLRLAAGKLVERSPNPPAPEASAPGATKPRS